MKRESVVSRTIKTTKVVVKFVDKKNNAIFERGVVLPGTYRNNIAIMAAVEKSYPETETEKAAYLVSSEVQEHLYTMKEVDFINSDKTTVSEPRKKKEEIPFA